MTTKDKVVHAIQSLPEDASIEDAMEKLYFLAKIEKGLAQANDGRTIPHSDVKARMARSIAS